MKHGARHADTPTWPAKRAKICDALDRESDAAVDRGLENEQNVNY
jgi:hypothetical protein